MKRSHTIFFAAVLLATSAANLAFSTKNVHPVTKMTRFQVSGYDGVAIGGPLKAYIKIGNQESIRFEGDQDAIAELTTEVKNGVLEIKPKTKWNEWNKLFRNAKVQVYITAKKINKLVMSGSGSIDMESPVNGTDLNVILSGSGHIKANANVNELKAVISGSGDISMSGKTDHSNVVVTGSGNFGGKGISAESLKAVISGSGEIAMSVSKTLTATITGSGTVHYSGNPEIHKVIVGSGSITKD
ncbi:head GIN domain-containing protein [Pedobacter nutrimenti]|jgi:hypothetical protein|uniref:Putative autotransporter adhesin-like protein n=1 Tax=Pedobacter nutrimenti TaxID=1241337 RepID=A0A318UAN3_9SPHI|nr:head GIN domain-containing protein [Pedobacter nutrimenti]PYF69999.1 putative autotransporter adhesin-like protein [Pedobacter nutrimenti]